MSLRIAMHFVCQNNEVTDSGSLIMNDCIFPEKYCDTETMLQNYLANEDEKKTRDREFMKMWKKCLEIIKMWIMFRFLQTNRQASVVFL